MPSRLISGLEGGLILRGETWWLLRSNRVTLGLSHFCDGAQLTSHRGKLKVRELCLAFAAASAIVCSGDRGMCSRELHL
jgi:hypothetical protein